MYCLSNFFLCVGKKTIKKRKIIIEIFAQNIKKRYICIVNYLKRYKMSTYYKINGLKVRVSDHEPNFSMDRMRGTNDVELYTIDACGNKLSVVGQIERYCEKHDLEIELFAEVMKDFPEQEYIPTMTISKIEVTAEFIEGYRSISGKGSMKKKDRYCEQHGIDAWKVSQGNYIVK